MSIPNSQFEIWAKCQTIDALSNTYNSVKEVLTEIELPSYVTVSDPYLQGSYANKTNTYAKADIDIVFELTSCAYRYPHWGGYGVGCPFGSNEWRPHLENYLIKVYGRDAIDLTGSKTIKIKEDKAKGRKPVDIVPALTYKYYLNQDLAKFPIFGIGIYDKRNREVIFNFPKIHQSNSTLKHQNTDELYKKYVRIFKNIRKNLPDGDYSFPSYFIEGIIYNVPNSEFEQDFQQGFYKILIFLLKSIQNNTYKEFICPNHIDNLFGDKSTQWNINEYERFLLGVTDLDDSWT